MSGEVLPPYSGNEATCIKCGCEDAYTEWMTKLSGPMYRVSKDGSPAPRIEHLKRGCSCCGYEWAEACVDQVQLSTAPEPGSG